MYDRARPSALTLKRSAPYLAEELLGVLQHVMVVFGRGQVHPGQLGRGEEQGHQGHLVIPRVQRLVDLRYGDDAWRGKRRDGTFNASGKNVRQLEVPAGLSV